MMRGDVVLPARGRLQDHIAAIQEAARPGSKAQTNFRGRLDKVIREDHRDKILRGVDGRGRPMAPLAASTLANPRRGPGGPLGTHGARARFITHFFTRWVVDGGQHVLVAYFSQLLSKPTKKSPAKPFAQYHLTGATKPGTRWVLPKRNVAGITPSGWVKVRQVIAQFWVDARQYGGGR